MQVNQSNFSKCENGKSLIQIYPLINYVKQKNELVQNRRNRHNDADAKA